MDAGTWATEGAGNTPAPILGTGRVRAPTAGVYCTVGAICNVEAASGVTALPPAAAANCRSAAGIGASGAEVPDTASGVLVAAGSERDVPATLDVVPTLPDPEVTGGEPLKFAEGALDIVGTLVELPMPVDAVAGPLPPLCAETEAVVA
ncbi:hypothetical protein PR002_g22435 [Phytophthora rubi]|uniref:Uncharacterized protein n=1 Tax=Phytophthora rubi TaxID=129364 RepID=A0A6A3IT32_9STRA|nr:hypothetical protein PR002_g22435 [Phytophthora rubi]